MHNHSYLYIIQFWREQYDFDQMNEVCISQGNAATFFRCGGQIHSHICKVAVGFRLPKNCQYQFTSDSELLKNKKSITFLKHSVHKQNMNCHCGSV